MNPEVAEIRKHLDEVEVLFGQLNVRFYCIQDFWNEVSSKGQVQASLDLDAKVTRGRVKAKVLERLTPEERKILGFYE